MEQKRRTHYESLRFAYELAFQHFTQEVERWQCLSLATAELSMLSEAKNRVEAAQQSYRERRNDLAEFLIANRTAHRGADPLWSEREAALVQERAYRLWQTDGCPVGNDQAYWYRAEASLLASTRKACA